MASAASRVLREHIWTHPLTVLAFENRTDIKYAKLLVHFPVLEEITVCAYIQWDDNNSGFATVFSYAVPKFFNEFQLRGVRDEKGFVRFAIIVHGRHTPYSPVFPSDGQWHHFCVTWQKLNGTWAFYVDGKKKASSSKLSASQDINEGGAFIVGQDQDSFGGTFKENESFSGNLTNLNVWKRVLSRNEIQQIRSCGTMEKDIIFGWKIHHLETEPTLHKVTHQFVCPGFSEECQILQTNKGEVGYTSCVNELSFVCYYTQDIYERLRNISRSNRARTFSSRVNTIANKSLISENPMLRDSHLLDGSSAITSLQVIEQVIEADGVLEEPADILGVIQILRQISELEDLNQGEKLEELSHHFVQVTGSLLEQQDPTVWAEINPIILGPMTIVHTVEKMASNLVNLLSDDRNEISIHHRNIDVGVRQINLDADNYMYTVQSTERVDQIEIPTNGLKIIAREGHTDATVINTWFDFVSLHHVLDGYNSNVVIADSEVNDGGYRYLSSHLGSAIISSTVMVGSQEISTSVQYRLWHKKNILGMLDTLRHRPVCAFWNFTVSPETGGGWSSYGCSMKSTSYESTTCFCNHTTNFAVLLQVYDIQRSSEEEWTLRTLTFIGCGVSLCALLVTFVLFLAVGVPKSERTTVHKNLIFALAAAEALLMFSELAKTNQIVCVTVTASLHLFFLAAFAWMLVEGLLLWSKVVAVNMSEDRRMRFYYITGWGLPIVIVSVTLATSFNKYVADSHCWLNIQTDIIWAFVGPVLFILTVNTFVLFRVIMVTVSSARRRSKMLTPNCSMEKQIRLQVWATAKPVLVLLPVLGLTWLCGVLVHLNIIWAYAFIILNSFQGLYIFLVYAIYNSEVRTAIQRMKEKKKALSFTNCSHPTNYVSSPRNTISETGKPSLTPPLSSLSTTVQHGPLPVKTSIIKGNIGAKHPVNISSILLTEKNDIELTAFKTSGQIEGTTTS
ncbi:adhesion G-protein coupled receptor D2 [Bombina bombina]|uniref:adhesion G-protein coupled receptor D2 n=1 Tax=Bombina bombina TaxID=8345 RepID=UPI00235A7AE4|nr:adhesion G-protein coupled receptor D2 [Bombina bombina]